MRTKKYTGYRLSEITPLEVEGLRIEYNGAACSLAELRAKTDIDIKDKIMIGRAFYRIGTDNHLTCYYDVPGESTENKLKLMRAFVARITKHLQDGILISIKDSERSAIKNEIAKLQSSLKADMPGREKDEINAQIQIKSAFIYSGECLMDTQHYSDFVKLREHGTDQEHPIISAHDTKRFFAEAAGEVAKPFMNQATISKFYLDKAHKCTTAMCCIEDISQNIKNELNYAFTIAQTDAETRSYMLGTLDKMRLAAKARTGTRGTDDNYYHLECEFIARQQLLCNELAKSNISNVSKEYISKLIGLTALVTEYRLHLNDSLQALKTARGPRKVSLTHFRQTAGRAGKLEVAGKASI